MFDKPFLTVTLSAFVSLSVSPAFAGTSANDSQSADAQPAQTAEPGVRVGQKQHGMRGMRSLERIRNLSSLTPEQKQKIDGIMSAFREEIRPLRQKAVALHQQIQSAAPDDKAGAAAQASLDELKPLIKQKSKEAINQVKQVLTAQQIDELRSGGQGSLPGKQPESSVTD